MAPPRCPHCGFGLEPEAGGRLADDVAGQLPDLGFAGGQAPILVLVPEGAADSSVPNITCLSESKLPADRPFDLILLGDALMRAVDVNRLMAALSQSLAARGLMACEVTGGRFGRNSLQILLERHGFRVAARPLKWRLSSWSRRRVLARKL